MRDPLPATGPKMTKSKKTQNHEYLENGASYEEKYEQHFCAARREESNGLCLRSIRPVVFELWPKM